MEKGLMKREKEGITPWDPFREFKDVKEWMRNFLDTPFNGNFARLMEKNGYKEWLPAVDIEEKDKEYIVTAEIPGIEKDDLKVEVKDGLMRIYGEKKSESETKGKNLVRHEQYYGKFERQFSLPQDIEAEDVKASYKNGVLKIHVPRNEELKTKAVSVKVD